MGIIKIDVVNAPDTDPPAALFQPAKLFYGSIADTDHRIDAAFVFRRHQIRPLMAIASAVGTLKKPGIFIGDDRLSVLVLRNRKTFQILPDVFVQSIVSPGCFFCLHGHCPAGQGLIPKLRFQPQDKQTQSRQQ